MRTKKQQSEFIKQTEIYLHSIGANFVKENIFSKWFKLDTVAGILNIGLDQPDKGEVFSIYGRFDDISKAKNHLEHKHQDRLNQYSGKWNHHGLDAETTLYWFKLELTPLLITE